jgi:hypothetical protein
MAARTQGRGIELADDMEFQRRSWRAERVGRLLIFAGVLAALTGAFGGGGLGSTEARSPDGRLAVRYERIARNHAEATMAVRVAPELVRDGRVSLVFDRALGGAWDFRSSVPGPRSTRLADGDLVLEFELQPGADAAELRLLWQTREAGPQAGEVGVVGGPKVRLRTFVFP